MLLRRHIDNTFIFSSVGLLLFYDTWKHHHFLDFVFFEVMHHC